MNTRQVLEASGLDISKITAANIAITAFGDDDFVNTTGSAGQFFVNTRQGTVTTGPLSQADAEDFCKRHPGWSVAPSTAKKSDGSLKYPGKYVATYAAAGGYSKV